MTLHTTQLAPIKPYYYLMVQDDEGYWSEECGSYNKKAVLDDRQYLSVGVANKIVKLDGSYAQLSAWLKEANKEHIE